MVWLHDFLTSRRGMMRSGCQGRYKTKNEYIIKQQCQSPSNIPLSRPDIGPGSCSSVCHMMAAARQEWVEGVKVSHRRSRGAHWSILSHGYVDGRAHCHLDNIKFIICRGLGGTGWSLNLVEQSTNTVSTPVNLFR